TVPRTRSGKIAGPHGVPCDRRSQKHLLSRSHEEARFCLRQYWTSPDFPTCKCLYSWSLPIFFTHQCRCSPRYGCGARQLWGLEPRHLPKSIVTHKWSDPLRRLQSQRPKARHKRSLGKQHRTERRLCHQLHLRPALLWPPALEVSISTRPRRGQVSSKAKSPSRTRDAKHCQIRTLSHRRRSECNGWL